MRPAARGRLVALALVATVVLLTPALAWAGDDEAAAALARGLPALLLFALALGAGTALTPCVLPMIPITMAVFGARQDVRRVRAVTLALTYVAGIVATFGVLGVAISLLGKVFNTGGLLGNPWFVWPLAVFFLVMAASMFGAFELNLPGPLQERLSRVGGAGYGGAFAMGLVAGLIASPCVAAPLLSLLAVVATRAKPLEGLIVMGTYGLGLGWPFFVVAGFALSLPKSGPWMEAVKSALGLVMVAAALYYLRGVVPPLRGLGIRQGWFIGVSLGLVVVGIVLGALQLSFHDSSPLAKARKALGLLLCAAGLYGGLAFVLTPRAVNLTWRHDEAAAVASARAESRPELVDFTATWCVPCQEFRVKTFADPEVAQALKRFVLVEIDVTRDDDEADKAKQRHGAGTLPAVVLYDSSGRRVRLLGEFTPPRKLLPILQAVK
ncbi:MAG: thioredoxin family protein [Deltaproteobacteria bacterium]|nr:thioredoxin family protein [Deltaproteobacteria bacterium]